MSRHRGSCAAVAFLTIAILWNGCTWEMPNEELSPTHDLIREMAAAEFLAEVGELDLQDPESKRYLVDGWKSQRRFVWGVGQQSELEFPILQLRDLQLSFECRPYSPPGAPTQTLSIDLNGSEIITLDLRKQRSEYAVGLPRESLRLGRNRLRFRYAYGLRPADSGNKDSRRLAVTWFGLRLEPQIRAVQPRVDPEISRLFLPFGAQLDFHVALEPRSRLIAEDWVFRGSEGGRLEILIEQEDADEVLLATLRGRPPPGGIMLSGADRKIARLSLRTVLEGPSSGSHGVALTRPMVVAPRPDDDAGEEAEASAEAQQWDRRPNLIIYLIDTLRADHLGSYGYAKELSPALDAFAREGLLFENAFAQSSWTKSSVASILTGLPPLVHGANNRDHVLSAEALTLQEILRRHGYRTAAFVTNRMVSREFGFGQGFDDLSLLGPVDGETVNQKVRDWLGRREPENQPFFLYIHTMDPHWPYDPPDEFRDRYAPTVPRSARYNLSELQRKLGGGKISPDDIRADILPSMLELYDGEVASSDRSFGNFRAMLEGLNLYEETAIILLSDHGEEFLEHGGLAHARELWTELLQVPLILKPAGMSEGRRVTAPVQHLDVLPTVLDHLGLGAPGQLPGRSLLDLAVEDMLGPVGYRHRQIFSYIQMVKGQTPRISVIEGRWKLIAELDGGRLENPKLFNVIDDPAEARNLAAQRPVRTRYLLAAIRHHMLDGRLEAETVVIDEDLQRSLRALGYLE